MTTPELSVEIAVRSNAVISRLEKLVGGSLTAGEISIDRTSDPDEDAVIGPERIPGSKDRLDVLSVYLHMDPVLMGIITKQVSSTELHVKDKRINNQEAEAEARQEKQTKQAI